MLVFYGGTPTWRLHTGLCKFVQNISTNIWSLGKRTDLEFGEMPYLFISYNTIISWLYTVNGFRIIFLLRDSANQEFAFDSFRHEEELLAEDMASFWGRDNCKWCFENFEFTKITVIWPCRQVSQPEENRGIDTLMVSSLMRILLHIDVQETFLELIIIINDIYPGSSTHSNVVFREVLHPFELE